MSKKIATIAASLLLLAACDKKQPEAPSEPPKAQEQPTNNKAAAPETPPTTEPEAPSAPAPTLDEAEAKALVQAWLDAQNNGDFDAYSAVYAPKLTGIKRIGERTFNYNRDGWLKDRKRMFQKKMQVSMDDLKLQLSSHTGVASFTQTWESGTFKDVGPKQLVIVKEGDALKIAREEMLSSKLDKQDEALPKFTPEEFAFARAFDNFIGIDVGEAPEGIEQGKAKLMRKPDYASKDIKADKLPAEVAAIKGKSFTLYGPKGKVCTANVKDFVVSASATPHFGQVQTWEEEKSTDAQIASGIWGLGTNATRLIATLDIDPKACAGAIFARESTLSEPKLYKPLGAEKSKAYQEPASKLYRSSTGYTSRAKDWKSGGERGDWWDNSFTTLDAFANPDDPQHAIVAMTYTHGECGAPVSDFWHIIEAKGQSYQDVLTPQPETTFVFIPEMVVDIDGDGTPELFDQYKLLRMVNTRYRLVEDIEPPYFDCPC